MTGRSPAENVESLGSFATVAVETALFAPSRETPFSAHPRMPDPGSSPGVTGEYPPPAKNRFPTLFRCASLHPGSFKSWIKAVPQACGRGVGALRDRARGTAAANRRVRLTFADLWRVMARPAARSPTIRARAGLIGRPVRIGQVSTPDRARGDRVKAPGGL